MIMIKFESLRSAKSLVPLLGDGELDTLSLGKRDVGLVALACQGKMVRLFYK